jgi:hypothetical protein
MVDRVANLERVDLMVLRFSGIKLYTCNCSRRVMAVM